MVKNCGAHKEWNTIQPRKKDWNSIICDNMDETGCQNVKWSKPGIETQVPDNFTLYGCIKTWIS
jgi:hypothetical protein